MSDRIRVNPEDLDRDVLDDIKKDIASDVETTEMIFDPIEVPIELPGISIYEKEIPNESVGEPISWSTATTPPAETISAQGFNANGVNSSSASPNYESGLKSGPLNNYGDVASGAGATDPESNASGGEEGLYDDSSAGNGYNKNRNANQRQNKDDKEEKKDDDKKDPKEDDKKKKDQTGKDGQTSEEAVTDPNKAKTQSELDKEKAKEKEEEAVDKAATNAMVANGDPNQQAETGEKKVPQEAEKADDKKKASPDETGNGYGAVDKKKQPTNNNANNDATARARRNLEHQNKVNNGGSKSASSTKKKPSKSSSTPKSGSPVKNALAKAGNGLKNKFKNLGKKKDSGKGKNKGGTKGSDVVDKGLGAIKNAILLFMQTHPVISIVIIIILLLIIIFMIETAESESGSKGRGKRSCTYELSGVTSTGTAELTNLRVEVINCDGTADNYEVLDTVDFEKYVLGVALAEAGPSSPDEAIKAQIIAVRNFTLTRNSGMCPGNPSDCFYGYNESSGIIRMRACTNDQVYWDYTKDCPKIERSGQPTLYCEGVDGSTDVWKQALSEERQEEVEALASEVMGEVLLDEHGNVLQLGYQKDETDQFIADANAGKSYVEILESTYGSNNYSSADCKYGGIYDYNDYTLSSQETTILHEPLDEFLEDNGSSLEEFNELIADNVDDAGWGTRAGVVAAAVTLIGELGDNYGVKVPYFWGGGHYDGVVDGALGYWGSTECHAYANNQHYNYCGFDCSGFVPWAIKNGGFKKGVDLAANFKNMPNARKVTLTDKPELQPGDLLESEQHIVLVVGIDEAAGQYICAEAMGNAYGVLFSRRSFKESGYWGVDLEDYYNDPNYIREPIR